MKLLRLWNGLRITGLCALVALAGTALTGPAHAGKNGTTLAAVKTIEICSISDTLWKYSGEIAVWNEGAVDTQGLAIDDEIQNKIDSTGFHNVYQMSLDPTPTVIAAGTTQLTATVFQYSAVGAPLDGDIRNVATITIDNHSGSLGTPKGPQPKATWIGEVKPCQTDGGCTYTQGYWSNKPDVVWSSPYDRNASFYLSGQTWQQVMDTSVNVSQGYYQLAHQFIAAALNKANGAAVPAGVQDILNQAEAWLVGNSPAACTAKSSCGTQKDWAAILDSYNNGLYPGGPPHCAE